MQANMCQHQKPDGTTCQCVATRNSNYCRHHARYYDLADIPAGRPDFLPPIPDHPDANLLSIHQAKRALLAGKIDIPTFRALVFAARVESAILCHKSSDERFAYRRDRELKREQQLQQRADSRTQRFLDALHQQGYKDSTPANAESSQASPVVLQRR